MCSVIPPYDYSYPFNSSHVFVEFFLFVTGYMTFKHFRKKEFTHKSVNVKAREALSYTFRKFKIYLPYILISAALFYVIPIICREIAIGPAIKETISDILFLTSQKLTSNVALWYISAMFIVFPLFCLLCQTRRKYLLVMASLIFVPVYYLNHSLAFYGPESLNRVFAGLLGGVLVSELTRYLRKNWRTKNRKRLLLAIGLASFAASIFLIRSRIPTFIEIDNGYIYVFASFIIMLAVLFSGRTPLTKVQCCFFDYLERISLPIYLLHLPVKILVLRVVANHTVSWKLTVIAIYLSSIMLAVAIDYIFAKIRGNQNKTRAGK